MAKHVAIKTTYNNGGEGVYVGFNGTCSEDIIKRNIKSGRVWCSQPDCECRKYYDRGFKGKRPVDPCYESSLFRDWQFGAGWYHTGLRAGTPIHLSNAGEGKIAILTTRFPGETEIDRKITGFFKIAEVIDKPKKETMLVADRNFALRLPMEEAMNLFFWDYYSTIGGARWGTGLIRYLNDSQTSRILVDLKETVRDEKAKEMLGNLLARDFPKIPPPASGPRIIKSGSRIKRVSLARKYGSVGEGIDHRKLKDLVARNPGSIGLFDVRRTEIEYVFPSGDTADIVFTLPRNHYAIVEIETINPLPGCYQALKYKVLKCAELGIPITSPDVEAILVAWSTSKYVEDFCTKYGIRFVKKKT